MLQCCQRVSPLSTWDMSHSVSAELRWSADSASRRLGLGQSGPVLPSVRFIGRFVRFFSFVSDRNRTSDKKFSRPILHFYIRFLTKPGRNSEIFCYRPLGNPWFAAFAWALIEWSPSRRVACSSVFSDQFPFSILQQSHRGIFLSFVNFL